MEILKKAATNSQLSAYSKTVFAYLYSIADGNIIKFKKCEMLARELKINPKTFAKSVKQLEKFGYITVFRSIFCANVYVLNPNVKSHLDWRKPISKN